MTPLIKIFEPERIEEGAEIELQNLKAILLDGDARERLNRMLDELDIRALLIAPDYNQSRMADTGSQLVCYYVPGDKVVRLIAMLHMLKDVFGDSGMLPYDIDRESEARWGRNFGVRDPLQNPVRQIFEELDQRGASSR
jgi:hypothetical protein